MAESAFRARGWKSTVTADRWGAFTGALKRVPDMVVLHGDGVTGQTVHLCQRFKHTPLQRWHSLGPDRGRGAPDLAPDRVAG